MEIVAGLTLKNLKPRVWDPSSPYYLPELSAVMVSYADFHKMPTRRRKAMEQGLHRFLDAPEHIKIYLDNGAFSFIRRQQETPRQEYEEFVTSARPDWWSIPQDYIPLPRMTPKEQRLCLDQTMDVNRQYTHDGYVPIIHVSRLITEYLDAFREDRRLSRKPCIGLGGIVPNLLRTPRARPYAEILAGVRQIREVFADRQLHLFGIGGTATLHLAKLMNLDSVDSSGWRNRAARGLIQLPGSGDRLVANLGSWRGRVPSTDEWELLEACSCPACREFGAEGLRAERIEGFCNRATHNLWILLDEVAQVECRLADGSYASWYEHHLNNSIYLPLVRQALAEATA